MDCLIAKLVSGVDIRLVRIREKDFS